MCNDCYKGLKGWSKSFTKIEICLSIIEGILLIILIGFLAFLISHFLACYSLQAGDDILNTTTVQIIHAPVTLPTCKISTTNTARTIKTTSATTLAPGIKCTWSPSAKTRAPTHYYEHEKSKTNRNVSKVLAISSIDNVITEGDINLDLDMNYVSTLENNYEDFGPSEDSDGEYAEGAYKDYIIALVKLKPPTDVVFGCVLTVITQFWTLTAASCVESIEEIDSLDFFVMMEGYGEVRAGRTHAVADVRVGPRGGGGGPLAALRSAGPLAARARPLLPTALDHLPFTIGERLIILGYGPFRSIDKSPEGRRMRKVHVYRLPAGRCARGGAEGGWAARHLTGGGAREAAACGGGGGGGVCAGELRARGAACGYCAGTPLLARALLLAVMSDDRQCGAACDPQLYVSVAAARDWIDSVVQNKG